MRENDKTYESPELAVIVLANGDVITESNFDKGDNSGDPNSVSLGL